MDAIDGSIVLSEQHLGCYLAGSLLRNSNRKISDFERAKSGPNCIKGKRLIYRRIHEGQDQVTAC
jgi:hypothetical protein